LPDRTPKLLVAFVLSFLLAACGEKAADAPEPVEPQGVSASDALPDLAAPASGIAFWTHPNVAFNGLMIVANAEGVVSYNIEDGNEVSRIPGVNAQGAAISYFGYGPEAAGVLVFLNADNNVFEFHGIDNLSRGLSKLEGEVAFRGAVRGFCLGRARGVEEPALFVLKKGGVTIFNLTRPSAEGMNAALTVGEPINLDAPNDIASCAVEEDGVLAVASEKGDVYRLDGGADFGAPFARAAVENAGEIALIASTAEDGAGGALALLDKASGVVTFFDRADGRTLGAVRIEETGDIKTVDEAVTMGASGANLGALYRSGAIALGVGGDAPSVALTPMTGVINTLDLPEGAPSAPRGETPAEDDGLLIDVTIDPKALQ